MHGMAMSVDIAILVEMAILVGMAILVEMAILVDMAILVETAILDETVIMVDFPLGAQNCKKIRKTKVSRFLPFYPLTCAFQTLARISIDGV